MPKDYNIAPYYDDFDEDKNFVRMLFNPGRAVQARELTQLQTILTAQNAKFADHFFQDGSKILGAKIELTSNTVSLTLNNFGGGYDASNFEGYYIKGIDGGIDTGAQAKVMLTKDSDRVFLAIRGGEFNVGDDIEVVDLDNNGDPAYTATITDVGQAMTASLAEGIVYISGAFVITLPETILVDPDSITGDWNLGFSLGESEVSYDQDSSLLDPAQGSYNYNAPGADRYKVTAVLKSYAPGNEPTDGTFYAKMFVVGGEIIKEESDTAYADILNLLAKRTYETNGDFTTDPFLAKKEDHPTDDTKVNIILDPGVAYVKGYRHETISETTLEVDKARDYLSNTESVWIDQSPYIKLKINDIRYLPAVGNLGELEFFASAPTHPPTPWDTEKVLGTARVSGFTFTGSEYRLYLSDYATMQGNFASVSGVKAKTGVAWTSPDFYSATVLEGKDDFNPDHTVAYSTTGNTINAYRFEQENLKSFDSSKFIHRIQRQASLAITSGTATVGTLASEEIDLSQNPIVISVDNGGTVFVPTEDYTTANSTTTELVIDFTTETSGSILVHYFVEVTGASRKSKIVSSQTDTFVMAADASFVTLSKEDIISIEEVVDITVPSSPINLNIENFTLDNGQRDFYYDYGVVSGTFDDTKTYTVKYNYYIHGGGGNYFDIGSYTSTGIAQDDIPAYISPDTGEGMFMGDVVDFRRKISEIAAGVGVPTPRSYMFCDYEYYLARADLVQIDVDGNFSILKGISSLAPVPPATSDNAMSLYVLTIPPYTYNAVDINTGFIENRNYTMRDIGNLDMRIGNLEYYSALSLLEKSADDLDITDADGNNVFKNGILADNFIGGNVVDTNDPEYFCAFDPELGHLRPVFDLNDVGLKRDERAGKHDNLTDNSDGTFSDPINNLRFHDNIVTLEYTEVPWVEQPQASSYMNVNPYNVFSWEGNLKLIPDTDYWIDTVYLPDIVTNVDGLYDNMIQKQINAYGTKWGSWKTNWTGKSSKTENIAGHGANADPSRLVVKKTCCGGKFYGNTVRTTTTISKQTRRGTRLVAVPNRIRKVVGERVVDVSVIPYMRARDVRFEAKNLKPNTNLHCMFNDVDVDAHITPDPGYAPVGSSTGHSCRTDDSGKVFGAFNLPNTEGMRFRTGQRPFELFDDPFKANTFGMAEYLAAGHIQKKQKEVLSISKPILSVVGVTGARTVRKEKREFVGWYDPVAESFLVEQDGGLFATSIEVFFKTKDASIPVSIMVVTTLNGYPSQNEVPYSNVTIDPADVNLWDGTAATESTSGTTFTFSDPIYLEKGTEYAFIVYSNSDSYNIWFGGMGEFDVQQLPDEVRITAQPYTGVFFKSQNGSTWNADQNKDLKFNINRAKFVTKSGDLKTGDAYLLEDISTLDTSTGVSANDFVFSSASKTIIGSGIDFTTVFSDGDKIRVGVNSVSNSGDYTINGAPTATSLTVTEALVNETSTVNVKIDKIQQVDLNATDIQIEVDELKFDLTEIRPAFKFDDDTLYTEYTNGEELGMSTQKHIANAIDVGSVTKNLEVNVYMMTENEYVSPVLSRDRAHCVLINNKLFGWNNELYDNVWKPLLDQPTVDANGQYYAGAYISRPTTLANPSDDLRVILDVWKQGSSDVEIFFSTGKFSPNYVEIWDGDIAEVRAEMKGEKIHLYNQATADDTCTYQTSAVCTGIDEESGVNRIYMTGVGDPDKFIYHDNWGTNKRQFITTEDLTFDGTTHTPAIITDWNIGTAYSIGDYVFYNSADAPNQYLWKAVEDSTGVAPTVVGTAWIQIPFNEVCWDDGVTIPAHGNEIIIDEERTWRPMVLESQDNDEGKATSQFVEYTWIPKNLIEEEFLTFQIKIQLKAKDPAYIPLCSGLRAIATF